MTAKDKILALVYASVQHGIWPFPMPEELAPFHCEKDPSTIHAGWLLWKRHVIVPMHETSLKVVREATVLVGEEFHLVARAQQSY